MTGASPVGALIARIGELEAEVEQLRAELVSEVIRTEDLAEALEEACDLVEERPDSERLVARWRTLLTAS